MVSDVELTKLRMLAVKAQVSDENEVVSEEEKEVRKENNKKLIVAVKNFLPDLIDELLELREEYELGPLEETPTDELNIYNAEVHITNNYNSTYCTQDGCCK